MVADASQENNGVPGNRYFLDLVNNGGVGEEKSDGGRVDMSDNRDIGPV